MTPLLRAAQAVARGIKPPELAALARDAFDTGATREATSPWFLTEIAHYIYAGDTLLHIAAAAHHRAAAAALVKAGADVRARNRRGAQPLHYAVDGGPSQPRFKPRDQAAIVTLLIEAGADPNALDASGVAPLHRAVRNRCAAAVQALLEGGANPKLKSGKGSTPLQLALATTGKSGSGDPKAKAQQLKILALLK